MAFPFFKPVLVPRRRDDRGDGRQHGGEGGDAAAPTGHAPGDAAEKGAGAAADIIDRRIKTDRRRAALLGGHRNVAGRHGLAQHAADGAQRQPDEDQCDSGSPKSPIRSRLQLIEMQAINGEYALCSALCQHALIMLPAPRRTTTPTQQYGQHPALSGAPDCAYAALSDNTLF